MNKYLIVVFYIVAGCTVAVPLEDVGVSEMSSEIWAEFTELANNTSIVNSQNAPKNSKAAMAAIITKADNGKILVSSLFALNNDVPCKEFSVEGNEVKGLQKRPLFILENINTSSIQIRGPGVC